MRVTQKAIAQRAGVSISTVSRTLSNARGIDTGVRRRVWDAALELGYQKHPVNPLAARDLPQTFKKIGLFTVLPSHLDAFHARILEGIEEACRTFDLDLSVAFMNPAMDAQAFVTKKLATESYDGLLFMSIDDEALPRQLRARGLEAVFINTDLPDLGFDTYLIDNWDGALIALRHLAEHGHRDILHLTNLDRTTIRRRFYAYQAFMLETTGILRPELVVTGPLGREPMYATMRRHLETRGLDFSAIFCVNDVTAIAAIKALQDKGFDVPNDVSVIGFDNLDAATLASPPLTTIHVACEHLGNLALQGVVRRFLFPGTPPVRTEVSPFLIERQTVARVRERP